MKDKFLTVLCGCGWLMSCAFAHAQSLTDIYQKARSRDNQFVAAQRSLDASLEKLPQARAGFLPTVNLVANKNHQNGEASFSEAPFVQRGVRSWSWTTQITQPLIRWSNWAAYSQAEAQVQQAQSQFALAQQDLIVRTAQVYFDLQLAMQNLQVAQAQLQAVNEQLTLAQRTYEVGMGTITDVHEANAKKALTLAQHVIAANDLTTKQAELEKLIGESMTPPAIQLVNNLPALDTKQLEDWLTAAAIQNPQILIQQAALKAASAEVSKNMAAHAPTLDLVANRSGNYSSGSLSSPADLSTRTQSNQVGIQLNVPLFAGGAVQSKVRESVALEEKAKEDLSAAMRNTSSQVRQAFAGIMNGQAQVEALKTAVEASQNAVESNIIGFKVGTRINPDVLTAQQQLYSAIRDLSKARFEMIMQSLKLKASVGVLVLDDLVILENLMHPTSSN